MTSACPRPDCGKPVVAVRTFGTWTLYVHKIELSSGGQDLLGCQCHSDGKSWNGYAHEVGAAA